MAVIVGILGSVTPPGRSLRALEYAMQSARQSEAGLEARALNLADYRISFADGRPPEQFSDDTAAVIGEIARANVVIFASPVYRGSFSGVLKNLLDNLPIEALMGKPCGIIAIGATPHHYLGVEWHLRDVLSWFGALVAPTAVYLSSADFIEGEPSSAAQESLAALVDTMRRLRAVAATSEHPIGPPPLAARRG